MSIELLFAYLMPMAAIWAIYLGARRTKTACPTDAITLVFGTERRGVDIPNVDQNFQTNVPGIFIAGELGGMGLVRNAVEQGRQAIDSIRALEGLRRRGALDVVIVGCGPAGLSASLAAMQHNLRSVTVEQVFEHVVRRTGLQVRFGERVDAVVRTRRGSRYKPRGRAIEPRRSPRDRQARHAPHARRARGGTEQGGVSPRRSQQYRGRHVLVVGGGDSALEAACSIADEPGTVVTLAHRGASFSRAKAAEPQTRSRCGTQWEIDRRHVRLGQANRSERCRVRTGRQALHD
jgi:thioredoxin reductase (NADPH)